MQELMSKQDPQLWADLVDYYTNPDNIMRQMKMNAPADYTLSDFLDLVEEQHEAIKRSYWRKSRRKRVEAVFMQENTKQAV